MRIKSEFDPNKIFFTSDHHFGHENIIKYTNRPFKSVSEMNEQLIWKWNEVVSSDSIVFYLGDLALTISVPDIRAILYRLNGLIYFAKGNHDRDGQLRELSDRFEDVQDVYEITVDDINSQRLFLSHYAHTVWNKAHKGSWHLFGHSHGSLIMDQSTKMDIGVDTHGFSPYSFWDVKDILSKRIYKSTDTHKT